MTEEFEFEIIDMDSLCAELGKERQLKWVVEKINALPGSYRGTWRYKYNTRKRFTVFIQSVASSYW